MTDQEYTYTGKELFSRGFKVQMTKNSGATHKYLVTRTDALPWPEKINMINFCDHGPGNFGGKVTYVGDIAYVDVYVD
jgi:hypothetical protein